jgi:polysaccharide deacetylase 2 family uncharacterized protein YibQ
MKNILILLISLLSISVFASTVCIVLDDFGYSGYPSRKILMMNNYPFTLAIMPFGPIATKFALAAKKAGFEIILHLPMQPHSKINRKIRKYYLTIDKNKKQLENTIIHDMLKVPGIVGANNHQGSLFTENEKKMEFTIQLLHKYGLFFMDSLTSSKSRATKASKVVGIPILKRNIFLDNIESMEYINKQLIKLFKHAERHGYAIGIGHARSKSLDALEKLLPIMLKKYPDCHLERLSELYYNQKN